MGTTIIWLLPMEFVKRLIALRKQRGLTQQALADAIDIHVNQIKRYEAGTAQPTLETLVRLAKELSTTLDDLVFGKISAALWMIYACSLKRSASLMSLRSWWPKSC